MTAIIIFDFHWAINTHNSKSGSIMWKPAYSMCLSALWDTSWQALTWKKKDESKVVKHVHKKLNNSSQSKYFKTLFNVSIGKQKHTLAKLQCCKTNMHVLFRINTSLSFKLWDNFQLFSVVIKYICTKYLYKYT